MTFCLRRKEYEPKAVPDYGEGGGGAVGRSKCGKKGKKLV